MRTLTVPEGFQGGLRLLLERAFPLARAGAVERALRKRDVKRDGKRLSADGVIAPGDVLSVFIDDSLLGEFVEVIADHYGYIVINKRPGISVLTDSPGETSLTDLVRRQCGADAYPCHRLDNGTGGLMLYARGEERLRELEARIKAHDVRRVYRCAVKGVPKRPEATLTAYLIKDAAEARVRVLNAPAPGAKPIQTHYRLLEGHNTHAELEVELGTGRTHQIRAHMAYIGHPLIGDDKYGDRQFNRAMGKRIPMLWSVRLEAEGRVYETRAGWA